MWLLWLKFKRKRWLLWLKFLKAVAMAEIPKRMWLLWLKLLKRVAAMAEIPKSLTSPTSNDQNSCSREVVSSRGREVPQHWPVYLRKSGQIMKGTISFINNFLTKIIPKFLWSCCFVKAGANIETLFVLTKLFLKFFLKPLKHQNQWTIS